MDSINGNIFKRMVLRLIRPTLTRRVVVALLLSFFIVWLVLIGNDYLTFKEQLQSNAPQRAVAAALLDSIEQVIPSDTASFAAVIDSFINQLRRDSELQAENVLFRLERLNGTVVYASPTIAEFPIAAEFTQGLVNVASNQYWAAAQSGKQWRVILLEPVIGDHTLLQLIGAELLPSFLIAFPLVLLPLWIAVRRGLSPLRFFVKRIAARSPEDDSPLGVNLRYAELVPLVTAFEGLLTRARKGIERERAFVQDAAHELRTPLAVITTQAHLLVNATDTASLAQARTAMDHAIERASHLVHQLLTLATLDNEAQPTKGAVDLVELTRQILIEVMPVAESRQIDLSLESAEQLNITLDVTAFHSILDNLLRNAIAYAGQGVQVLVSLSIVEDEVILSVSDDGNGIPAEERDRLFNRFERGRHTKTHGTGLGLCIVQQAAWRLGGTVSVGTGLESRGVEFRVKWPVVGLINRNEDSDCSLW